MLKHYYVIRRILKKALTISPMDTGNIVSMPIPTAAGNFCLYVWEGERGRELVALTTPMIDPTKEVMVRIHSECLTGDTFHSLTCDCGPQKDLALKRILEHGNGIFIYHRQEGRNAGLFKKVQAYNLMQQGKDTHEALLSLAGHPDPREYSEVLKVLNYVLKRRKSAIRLLTNNPYKALFLERHHYAVTIEPLRVETTVHSAAYTEAKTQKFLHNTVGHAPYVAITLSRSDVQVHLLELSKALLHFQPFPFGRKLFIGIGTYPQQGDLSDTYVHELQALHAAIAKIPNIYIVLHLDYPSKRSAQRDLKRFLAKLPFTYSLQFRLPKDTPHTRIDVDLIDALHAEHAIFQLKEEHFYLLDQKHFADYFTSPHKFLLLDESWATGLREDVSAKQARILKLISRGLSRVAVAGGYNVDNAAEIHQLEDYFKIPISVDAESRLRTKGHADAQKITDYLAFFFPRST